MFMLDISFSILFFHVVLCFGDISTNSSSSLTFTAVFVLSRSVVSKSLQLHRLQPARLLCPWESPGKNIGVACHFLLQGSFLTQGSSLCLLHWQGKQILYCCSHTFWETNSLRRTIQIVECSLSHRRAQGRVSSQPWTLTSFSENLIYPKCTCPNPLPQIP